jgi:hypothetical protein
MVLIVNYHKSEKMKGAFVIAVAFLVHFTDASLTDSFTDCATDVTVLEKALYKPDNVLQLNKIFYPPREPPTRFIKVTYEFEGTGCSVNYFWAVGGFLLVQPPKIFQLTSLYFSSPANKLTNLTIKLPAECQPLVQGDNCTCDHEDNTLLDILTQQVCTDS